MISSETCCRIGEIIQARWDHSDGKRDLPLHEGDPSPLKAILAAGSGMVQTKEKALLAEILERVNQLFDGELTEDDKVGYINTIKTKTKRI